MYIKFDALCVLIVCILSLCVGEVVNKTIGSCLLLKPQSKARKTERSESKKTF